MAPISYKPALPLWLRLVVLLSAVFLLGWYVVTFMKSSDQRVSENTAMGDDPVPEAFYGSKSAPTMLSDEMLFGYAPIVKEKVYKDDQVQRPSIGGTKSAKVSLEKPLKSVHEFASVFRPDSDWVASDAVTGEEAAGFRPSTRESSRIRNDTYPWPEFHSELPVILLENTAPDTKPQVYSKIAFGGSKSLVATYTLNPATVLFHKGHSVFGGSKSGISFRSVIFHGGVRAEEIYGTMDEGPTLLPLQLPLDIDSLKSFHFYEP